MATTTNFGWDTPDDTDYVTDGAAAMRELGQDIDTTLVDLKGGTTGQILSKASNTDMDFVWSAAASGDITGVSVTSPITGGGTSGDVTIGIATSAVVPSQTGNSGKYLTTDGTNSSWGTISAGGMTELASGSLSGNTLNLTSISSGYKDLRLVLFNYYTSARSNLQLTFNGSASGYTTMGGQGLYTGTSFNPTFVSATGWPASYAWPGNGNNNFTAAVNAFSILEIPNYTNTTAVKMARGATYAQENTGTSYNFTQDIHLWRNAAAINQITLKVESSNTWSGGTYILYGVN